MANVKNFPYPSLTDYAYQGFDTADSTYTNTYMTRAYNDGFRFVGRYLYESGKGVTREECQRWIQRNMAMVFFFEENSDDALKGYYFGYELGKRCQALIQSVGVPDGTLIFCCCDTEVTSTAQLKTVTEFYKGFRLAIPYHRVGIYGGLNVCQAVRDAYPDAYVCQAGGWGYSQEIDLVDVRQWAFDSQSASYIHVANASFNGLTYVWRSRNIDFESAPTLDWMWRNWSQPAPTPYTPPDDPPPLSTSLPSNGISGSGDGRYHKLEDCPDWSKSVLKTLLESGKLKGRGNGDLDLSEDMIRILTIIFREEESK